MGVRFVRIGSASDVLRLTPRLTLPLRSAPFTPVRPVRWLSFGLSSDGRRDESRFMAVGADSHVSCSRLQLQSIRRHLSPVTLYAFSHDVGVERIDDVFQRLYQLFVPCFAA